MNFFHNLLKKKDRLHYDKKKTNLFDFFNQSGCLTKKTLVKKIKSMF